MPQAWATKLEAIHVQLERIIELYLEARWSWPRRFSPAGPLSFLICDPRVPQLDTGELRHLADQLEHHLFGAAEEGEVSLLFLEGPEPAVTAFAGLTAEEVAAAVADPALLPAASRLTRIRPGVDPVVEAAGPAPA
jgi:hypothetical protein